MRTLSMQELSGLGVATVYEASGRQGLIDQELHQLVPGSRVAGPARTVLCAHGDNLMVHAVMAVARPGEVLVISMANPGPIALLGELLAEQALNRGVAGILINAAVRDAEELRTLGLPIWTRYIRARGPQRETPGQLNCALEIGGALIHPADIVVLDADGAVVVARGQLEEVVAAARRRAEREANVRDRFRQGVLSIDMYELREQVAAQLLSNADTPLEP